MNRSAIIPMLCLAVPAMTQQPPAPDEAYVPSFRPGLIPGAARPATTPTFTRKTCPCRGRDGAELRSRPSRVRAT